MVAMPCPPVFYYITCASHIVNDKSGFVEGRIKTGRREARKGDQERRWEKGKEGSKEVVRQNFELPPTTSSVSSDMQTLYEQGELSGIMTDMN